MKLCDVNVFVYAHRPDATDEHEEYAAFVISMVSGSSYFGLSELVLSGFARIVTNRKIFRRPTPVGQAFEFCEELRSAENGKILAPGLRHWEIFQELCMEQELTGKLVADAYHAALAIEYDCEWYGCDSDFSRFPGLRWKHPLG